MRITRTFTIAAGTPINVVTGVATAANESDRVYASRIFIQMLHGGSGIGYVMDGISYGRVPVTANDNPIELQAATSTDPGGNYTDSDFAPGGGVEVTKMWIDGGHTGDTVLVSYAPKI